MALLSRRRQEDGHLTTATLIATTSKLEDMDGMTGSRASFRARWDKSLEEKGEERGGRTGGHD